MSIKYGFYDSVDGDRKYSAEDFSGIFSGLFTEGVFETVGNKFAVTRYGSSSPVTVSVASGKAWCLGKYTELVGTQLVQLSATPASGSRYDVIVLRTSTTDRASSITVVTGTVADSPVVPAITDTSTVKDLALAYVLLNSSTVTIYNKVGTTTTPYVRFLDSYEAPVTSVNGMHGDVLLATNSILMWPDTTTPDFTHTFTHTFAATTAETYTETIATGATTSGHRKFLLGFNADPKKVIIGNTTLYSMDTNHHGLVVAEILESPTNKIRLHTIGERASSIVSSGTWPQLNTAHCFYEEDIASGNGIKIGFLYGNTNSSNRSNWSFASALTTSHLYSAYNSSGTPSASYYLNIDRSGNITLTATVNAYFATAHVFTATVYGYVLE